jgi:hypothetical protein
MHPQGPDDLSALERQLTGCEPATAGLDADAMLFAAGRASARPGPARFAWPALAACLAALAAVLGVWLAAERAERLTLARLLRQQPPAPVPAPAPPDAVPPEPTADQPQPSSLLAAHHALEQGLDAWPPQPVAEPDVPGPPAPAQPNLQVGWRDALLDP